MRRPELFALVGMVAIAACDRSHPSHPLPAAVDQGYATVGTSGSVDARIQELVDRALDDDAVLRERDITVEVRGGTVILRGSVKTAAEKENASTITRKVSGMVQVVNVLDVRVDD